MDADKTPIVIPFAHSGMQEVMPIGSNFPKVGKKVTVVVGDPIFLEDLIADDSGDTSRGIIYDAVSSRISHKLKDLKAQADKLALKHAAELQACPTTYKSQRGYGLWQQVDWEAFGMADVMQSEETSLFVEQLLANGSKNSWVQRQELSPAKNSKVGFYRGGIISRIRGCMNPAELMGFAASGLFKNGMLFDESRDNGQELIPVKWWKPFDGMRVFNARNKL